ncbi:ABC transporter substrate-binding protein [Candidatus Arthromitus sp. SFB-turkey]|uniref:ABC transporter substrate-binding protein n=1 Tax=Candidatus Arthromitus sp. SFB-turkey TaxID=1840217 RepID=UPI0007F540F8|nr:ABC transporter substrate-binding protein [Candidatus Arthromitus sp. SFB-turkey]OAT89634.1 peptide ABC transporter substrate-binding protein [Candidatus Arthromitus sp. SFB-turkey]
MRIIKVISLVIFFVFNLMFNVFQEKETANLINKISIGIVDLPDNLLYLSDESYVNNIIVGNLFEGLVNLYSTGEIVSGIAERYTVSEDGLLYKFYIRNDAYFSNGDLITAKDFLKFFEEIISKDEEKFYYDDLKYVVGIEEFYNGNITFDEVGIKVDKKNCLSVELKEKDDNFLKNLTKDKFSLRNNFKYLYNYKDFYEYISYSGAYMIDNVSKGEDENLKITLKPNKYYYLNNYKTVDQKVYSFANTKEIILEVFPTREFAIESYRSGKLNIVLDIPYNVVDNYFDSRDLYYVHNDSSNLILNLDEFKYEEKIAEVSLSLDDEDEEQKLVKGNFINFIIDTKDVRYINGLNSEILQEYVFDKNYILNKLKGYNFEENKVLKIVTHSDDNYIELARSFKEFLEQEFNISTNIVALEDEYIENELKESDYDILISHFVEENSDDVLSFDKPNLILSSIELNKNYIDGNGTIIINNIS